MLTLILLLFAGLVVVLFLSIALTWMIKWIRRAARFFAHIFAIFVSIQMLILFVYQPLLIKYASISAAQESYVASGAIGCGFLVILLLFFPARNALHSSASIRSTMMNLKKNFEEGKKELNKKDYFPDIPRSGKDKMIQATAIIFEKENQVCMEQKANQDAWFFALCSMIGMILFVLTQIMILEMGRILPHEHSEDPASYHLFIILFFPSVALASILCINKNQKGLVRRFGQWVVFFNALLLSLSAIFLYDPYVKSFRYSLQFTSSANVIKNINMPISIIIAASFIAVSYLYCVNFSAFLFYGYDNAIAWLFEKPKDKYRINSITKIGNHWSQRFARWFLEKTEIFKTQRVPESVLHWHSVGGGSIGAYAGHRFFNHKKLFVMKRPLEEAENESAIKFAPVYMKTVFAQGLLLFISLAILIWL